MKWLKNFHSLFFKGFSPIVATIVIGLALFSFGYYFLAYKANLIPVVRFNMPQILKGEQINGPVIETNNDAINYDDVSPMVTDFALEIDLVEGQNTKVLGTDIFIKALKVDDLTGRGCLGGPLGCADRAELEVSRRLVRQNVILLSPKTAGVRSGGKDKAQAFGYTISLLRIDNKEITVRVEIVE
jgi:hypothetical protein